MNGPDRLTEYIRIQRNVGIDYSRSDCGAFLANWCEFKTGKHPWPELAGSYSNRDELRAFLGESHMLQVVGRIARRNGFTKTREPKRGDVGAFNVGNIMCLGICAGQAWFTKTNGIAVFKNVRVIAAWSIS